MDQNDQLSRYKVNHEVRIILARHEVDLTRIDYSFIGQTVYLTGELVRTDRDFTPQEIEVIARDISSLFAVRNIEFDLSNWLVISTGDAWEISRREKQPVAAPVFLTSNAMEDNTYVIKKASPLKDIIEKSEADSQKKDAESSSNPSNSK